MTDVQQAIRELRELLDLTADHYARAAEIQAAWDLWYDDCDDVSARYGLGPDADRYRTVDSKDLPRAAEPFADPYRTKQQHVETLHRLGDPRAVDVLIAALADRACLPAAAAAFQDIRSDRAVPAMMDGLTTTWDGHDYSINAVAATLRTYGVTADQVRERYDAEPTPGGRLNLLRLMRKMPGTAVEPAEEQVRDDLVYVVLGWKDGRGYNDTEVALSRMYGEKPIVEDDFGQPGPAAHLMRAGMILVAQGKPSGHEAEMRRRVLHYARTPAAAEAVESVLTEESDEELLRFALYVCLKVPTSRFANPLRVLRILDHLLGKRSLSEDAMLVLRRTDLLFDLMLVGNEEAQQIFRSFATEEDEARWARRAASRRPEGKIRRWLRRR